jgi:hypothetical protein
MTRPRLLRFFSDANLLDADPDDLLLDTDRPETRGDCLPGGMNEQRPCPYVSCRHHIYLDVTRDGALRLNFPDIGPDELEKLPGTCALDLADQGGLTLEDVGEALGVTRERARQLEERVLVKVRPLRDYSPFNL